MLKQIQELRERVLAGTIPVNRFAPLWCEADVIVALQMSKEIRDWLQEPPLGMGLASLGRQAVCTKQAYELSHVFKELQRILGAKLNFNNRFEFYGRLAVAAEEGLKSGDGAQVLLAALDEAERFTSELENTP